MELPYQFDVYNVIASYSFPLQYQSEIFIRGKLTL